MQQQASLRATESLVVSPSNLEPAAGRFYDATASISTSHPFEVGMPVPSVDRPIKWHVGGPYGTKIIPGGTLPSTHVKTTSACSVLIRTLPPDRRPAAFMSSGCIVTVLTVAWYSAESLPIMICWPCFVVRPAFMMKRFRSNRIASCCRDAAIIAWRSARPRRPRRGGRAPRDTRRRCGPRRTPCRWVGPLGSHGLLAGCREDRRRRRETSAQHADRRRSNRVVRRGWLFRP